MLQVEIWSDVVCPFCYMGKRRFENALDSFEHKKDVQVVWRSFQLDPDIRPAPGLSIFDYLAERKGIPASESRRLHAGLTATAAKLGLSYNFDKVVVANTFDAHRVTHLARERGVQHAMEERLFAAYFTEGRNIADVDTLAVVGAEAGLDPAEIRQMVSENRYANEVRSDAREAAELGADGVPFYVFNRAYAVSGAQPSELFLEVLQKVWEERASVQLQGSSPS